MEACLLKEMESVSWVQVLDGGVCVTFSVYTLWKNMNPSVLLPNMGK